MMKFTPRATDDLRLHCTRPDERNINWYVSYSAALKWMHRCHHMAVCFDWRGGRGCDALAAASRYAKTGWKLSTSWQNCQPRQVKTLSCRRKKRAGLALNSQKAEAEPRRAVRHIRKNSLVWFVCKSECLVVGSPQIEIPPTCDPARCQWKLLWHFSNLHNHSWRFTRDSNVIKKKKQKKKRKLLFKTRKYYFLRREKFHIMSCFNTEDAEDLRSYQLF